MQLKSIFTPLLPNLLNKSNNHKSQLNQSLSTENSIKSPNLNIK